MTEDVYWGAQPFAPQVATNRTWLPQYACGLSNTVSQGTYPEEPTYWGTERDRYAGGRGWQGFSERSGGRLYFLPFSADQGLRPSKMQSAPRS